MVLSRLVEEASGGTVQGEVGMLKQTIIHIEIKHTPKQEPGGVQDEDNHECSKIDWKKGGPEALVLCLVTCQIGLCLIAM